MHPAVTSDLESRFRSGQSIEQFLATPAANASLWQGAYRRAEVPADLALRAQALPGRWNLLVLSADWCADGAAIVPVLARLAERSSNIDLRILDRDEHPDLRDSHLTNGAQAIPVVMLLDENFVERAWWGPRPEPLQRWVQREGMARPKEDRYREVRRWYARDRGRTTLEEVVELLEKVAAES